MTFVHDDPDFRELLEIVASHGPISSAAMVEKDYWICHSLWALEQSGIEFWFKGGTSLAKGFGLIPRFSEDIDLVILPGRMDLPSASSWKTETDGAIESRKKFWSALLGKLDVPGALLTWDESHDRSQRNAGFRIQYPGHFVRELQSINPAIRPYVLLEMSHGSVDRTAHAPSVERPITSFVHERLIQLGRTRGYNDNRAQRVPCVHPYVTLLEKLDAITHRYERGGGEFEPGTFARHYEDAARIIRSESSLPPIEGSIDGLAREMLEKRQIRRLVSDNHPALLLEDTERRGKLVRAYEALRPMYWQSPIPLTEAANDILAWLRRNAFATAA